jgi:hypothetical protein
VLSEIATYRADLKVTVRRLCTDGTRALVGALAVGAYVEGMRAKIV